ncbi:MAG: 4-(cytidine 5'-diphospho)-2-C-methyl-D-erythritol kinase [Prevotella sp.]|nr:4-(cytidine 5'-diphospho)-2-C-methyl-D-erythritol kinase [Prevotella sp.]
MKTFPKAKINLGLNVVSRRADGYHNLETVFYPVPLCDELEVMPAADAATDCELSTEGGELDCDPQQNLVVRAYELLKREFPTLPRVRAHLVKHIPSQAGLGGGSSDCTAMLCMLNQLFSLGLTDNELMQRAAKLGADCPFFVLSRPAYAEGIGEQLEAVPVELSKLYLAIVKPPIPVPTREAFSLIHPHQPAKNCRTVVSQPVETWCEELVNDFEQSVFALHPEIGEVKQRLYDMGALYAAMSGSGSSLFALFDKPVELTGFQDMFCYGTQLT